MKEVTSTSTPIIITHNGEAKLVIQDIKIYEEHKNALTLLKMLAQSMKSMKNRKYKTVKNSFNAVREKIHKTYEKV